MPTLSEVLIFIDTNIYLDCYQRRHEHYRKLLDGLSPIKTAILFTTAVHDEFRRNRVSAYLKDNKVTKDKTGSELFIPFHHASRDDARHSAIIRSKKEIATKVADLNRAVFDIHAENVQAIVKGVDDVSEALAPLIALAKDATADQKARARLRKELGNPPGKKGDPLGDQISWEQLKDQVQGKTSLYLVSNDTDYIDRHGTIVTLNGLLMDELAEANASMNVNVHDNLADFFEQFQKVGYVASNDLIPEVEIKNAKAEVIAHSISANFASTSILEAHAVIAVNNCPRSPSGNHELGPDLIPHPSQYGGWSYWQHCRYCGFRFDTGEPYDD